MIGTFHRRLTMLERTGTVCRTTFRAYATGADAEADAETLPPETAVVWIITGVPRTRRDGVATEAGSSTLKDISC